MIKAITLRNIPPRVARRISQRAARDRTSLNKAVIRLLEERSPPAEPKAEAPAKGRPRRDLSGLAGSWSAAEAEEFDAYLAQMRRIDPDLWK